MEIKPKTLVLITIGLGELALGIIVECYDDKSCKLDVAFPSHIKEKMDKRERGETSCVPYRPWQHMLMPIAQDIELCDINDKIAPVLLRSAKIEHHQRLMFKSMQELAHAIDRTL